MTNVDENNIFSSTDVNNKYLLPVYFYQKKLDQLILKKLGIYEKYSEIDF